MRVAGSAGPDRAPDALTWASVKRYYSHISPAMHLVPLPAHGVIYVKNPKAGSSTLMVWLDRIHTGEFDADLEHMHKQNRLPKVRDVGRRKVVRMLRGDAYRFSFVRDPVNRLESVYWAKMVRSRGFRLKAAAKLGIPADPDTVIPFETFLGAVEQQDPLTEMDPHWRPQHVNLLHPLVGYDHVGRVETFDADIERVREEAGLPHVPVEPRNVSRRRDPSSVYDGRPDLVRRVEELYARDLEMYGY